MSRPTPQRTNRPHTGSYWGKGAEKNLDELADRRSIEYIGATHFQEVAFVMNNLGGGGYAVPPIVDDASRALARTISTAWVNFIASLNPNGAQGTLLNGLVWPTYDLGSGGGVGQNVVWSVEGAGSYVETDAYRIEGINWMIDNGLTVFGN